MLLCDSPSPRGQLYKDHPLPLGPREARGQIRASGKDERVEKKIHRLQRGSWSAHSPALTL